MGAAVISGLFAVVLACLAWIFKNGSRRARLLSRIERYSQVLKDLPEGHPARAHLDAALAADSEQLLALTGWKAPETSSMAPTAPQPSDPWYPPAQQPPVPWYPPSPRPPVKPGPAYPPAQRQRPVDAPAGAGAAAYGAYEPAADDPEDRDDIDWVGEDEEPGAPCPPPAAPAIPVQAPPATATQPPGAGSAGFAFGPPPPPKRALLSGHGSTILWVLAGLSAVATVGLVINDIFTSSM